MMLTIPQLQLTEEEFERLNNEAAQAGIGLYDYIAVRLVGRTPPGRKPPETQAVTPADPGFETKTEFKARRKAAKAEADPVGAGRDGAA